MPLDSAYIRRVIKTYTRGRDRMGAFPLPDYDVVAAVEVLKDHLRVGGSSHAVEVAKVTRGIKTRFVFANSGAPGALSVDLDAARRDLKRVLGPAADYVQVTRGSDFYEPHHRDVDTLLKKVRANFEPGTRPVRRSDVTAAIGGFREHFVDYGGGTGRKLSEMHPRQRSHVRQTIKSGQRAVGQNSSGYVTQQSLVDRSALLKSSLNAPKQGGPQQAAAEALFAGLAALRLRMVEGAGRAAIANDYRQLSTWLKTQKVRPWLPEFAAHIDVLLRPGDAVVAPGTAIRFRGIQRKVDGVYRALTQSRFCAEPRVFGAISQDDEATGRLASQACIWWIGADNTPNPGEYQVIGPRGHEDDPARTGSYMWACSSCRARSSTMLGGISRSEAIRRPHEV